MNATCLDRESATAAMNLAVGRLFLLASRPAQPGDVRAYEEARHAVYTAAATLGIPWAGGYVQPGHIRERS